MYFVYFDLSEGLSRSIVVEPGFIESVDEHIKVVERALGYCIVRQLEDGRFLWRKILRPGVSDDVLCDVARRHNDWVRHVYYRFDKWSESPPVDGVELTPERAAAFWPALEFIDVPVNQWSQGYYINRMEHLFDVMTGNESEGVTFGADALTPQQAGAVVVLFSEFLDSHDTRLDVPDGCDYLTDDYDWCEKCGKCIDRDDMGCAEKGCPVRADYYEDEE